MERSKAMKDARWKGPLESQRQEGQTDFCPDHTRAQGSSQGGRSRLTSGFSAVMLGFFKVKRK